MEVITCPGFFNPADSHKGTGSGKSKVNLETANNSFKYELLMDITNQIYTDALLDHGSIEYEILYSQVNGAVSFSTLFLLSNRKSEHKAKLHRVRSKYKYKAQRLAPSVIVITY